MVTTGWPWVRAKPSASRPPATPTAALQQPVMGERLHPPTPNRFLDHHTDTSPATALASVHTPAHERVMFSAAMHACLLLLWKRAYMLSWPSRERPATMTPPRLQHQSAHWHEYGLSLS